MKIKDLWDPKFLPFIAAGVVAGWLIHSLVQNEPIWRISPIPIYQEETYPLSLRGEILGRAAPYLGWNPETHSY